MRYWIIIVVVFGLIVLGCKVDTVSECSEEGTTRCDDDAMLQTCVDSTWKTTETCATSGRECVERNGSAQCEMLTDIVEDMTDGDSDSDEDTTESLEVAEGECTEGICECPPEHFVVGGLCSGLFEEVAHIDDLEGFRSGYQNISMTKADENSYLGRTILTNHDGSIKIVGFDFNPDTGGLQDLVSHVVNRGGSGDSFVTTMQTYIEGTLVYTLFSDYLYGSYAISLEGRVWEVYPRLEILPDCEGAGDTATDSRCVSDTKELYGEGDDYFVAYALQYDGLLITTGESNNECHRTSGGWEDCVAWIESTDFIEDNSLSVLQLFHIYLDDSDNVFVLNNFTTITAVEVNFGTWDLTVLSEFPTHEEDYVVLKMEQDPEQNLFYLLGVQCPGENTISCENPSTVFQILELTSDGFVKKGKIVIDGHFPASNPVINKVIGGGPPSKFVSFAAIKVDTSGETVDGGLWVVDVSDIESPKTTRLPSYKLPDHTPSLYERSFVVSAIDDMLFVPWDIEILALRLKTARD